MRPGDTGFEEINSYFEFLTIKLDLIKYNNK